MLLLIAHCLFHDSWAVTAIQIQQKKKQAGSQGASDTGSSPPTRANEVNCTMHNKTGYARPANSSLNNKGGEKYVIHGHMYISKIEDVEG